uniref:Uncharacterized protein n=1 Tax=Skeletonema marinoi TaxID=267567 RepID=A0A7S2LC73_9STRA|mmetsp:Transcript_22827/g.38991  ORF Transcript_22827/g.38991 Transcript_22827/m.38991 type:complete len:324 (+) Transcript_22827:147-1118(+)
MVLNSHTPYDDPSDDEEEWEFLNSDDTTPNDLQLEVAEQPPPIAATPAAATNDTTIGLETTDDGSKHDVRSTDDEISNTEHSVAEEAAIMEDRSLGNRQDESETNSGASKAGRNNDVVSSEVMVEIEQQSLEEEHTSSVTSGGTPIRNREEEDSAPPPPQQQQQHTPNNTNDHPLRNTWNFLENTFQGIDNQHQLRRRTSNSVKHINQSMQSLFSNITDETQRVRDQADVHARNASTHVSQAASAARESISRANAEYKLSEKVATVAVIGGATLLALGNPRAGVTALAVAGASLAVGEITSTNYEESPHSREEYGLPEGVHID